MITEVTQPELRKDMERKGDPVIRSMKAALLKVNGKIYIEAKETENKSLKQTGYSLAALQKKDDKGSLVLTQMELAQTSGDPLVKRIEFTGTQLQIFVLDNSKLSSQETLAKLQPSKADRGLFVLKPLN